MSAAAHGVKLILIPEDKYSDYRYDAIFNAYKWDPQFEDRSTVAKHVVLLDGETAEKLETWAERLSEETMAMEEELIAGAGPAKELGLPKQIYRELPRLKNYSREKNVRLMRFDFHPVISKESDGLNWAVSEVNSDVPGGLAESSVLPGIAKKYIGPEFADCKPGESAAARIFEAFGGLIEKDSGAVAFIHATSYSDDRQVMQFLGDYFNKRGIETLFAAPDHIKWIGKKAVSVIKGRKCGVGGIVRFFPLEWMVSFPRSFDWRGYFDCEVPSCNHPAAILAQSKRLPLIWDKLDTEVPYWKKLLPPTADPKSKKLRDTKWLYKPAFGRVGEGIISRNPTSEKEIRRYRADWVVQEAFESRSLPAADNTGKTEDYHLCVGVFTVNGKRAGFYARVSKHPIIDSKAQDIPVLILNNKKIGTDKKL